MAPLRACLFAVVAALPHIIQSSPVIERTVQVEVASEAETALEPRETDDISSCGNTWMAIDDITIGDGGDVRTGYTSAVDRFCRQVDGVDIPSEGYLSVATETYISSGKPPSTYGILGYVYFEIHNKISSSHTADYNSCKEYLGTLSADGGDCYGSNNHDTKGGTYQVGSNDVSYHALANLVPPSQDAVNKISTDGAIEAQSVNKGGSAPLNPWPYDSLDSVLPAGCHSHNDYERNIPLFSALAAGCTGIEADVRLSGSDLCIGHDSCTPGSTLLAQYIDPLKAIIDNNGGSVWPAKPDQTLALLVDFKTDATGTLDAVVKSLQPLRDAGYLSKVVDGKFVPGAVTITASGSAPFDRINSGDGIPDRDVFFDAPVDGLNDQDYTDLNSYYASANFKDAIGNPGSADDFSEAQRNLVASQTQAAHDRGLLVRYYELPGDYLWEPLAELGVDRLNADDLQATARLSRI